MERPDHENVQWFIGTEVEHTPAFGMKTLFVVGIQDVVAIKDAYEKHGCEHIFFGANHTYDPKDDDEHYEWTFMIMPFLRENIWCTLDIPSSQFVWYNYYKNQIKLNFQEWDARKHVHMKNYYINNSLILRQYHTQSLSCL